MSGIRWLCERFPANRKQFIWLGYILLLLGGLFWFICFPLLAFTLFFYDKFPADLIGGVDPNRPSLPKHGMMIVSAAMTVVGLVILYFSIRDLKRLSVGK